MRAGRQTARSLDYACRPRPAICDAPALGRTDRQGGAPRMPALADPAANECPANEQKAASRSTRSCSRRVSDACESTLVSGCCSAMKPAQHALGRVVRRPVSMTTALDGSNSAWFAASPCRAPAEDHQPPGRLLHLRCSTASNSPTFYIDLLDAFVAHPLTAFSQKPLSRSADRKPRPRRNLPRSFSWPETQQPAGPAPSQCDHARADASLPVLVQSDRARLRRSAGPGYRAEAKAGHAPRAIAHLLLARSASGRRRPVARIRAWRRSRDLQDRRKLQARWRLQHRRSPSTERREAEEIDALRGACAWERRRERPPGSDSLLVSPTRAEAISVLVVGTLNVGAAVVARLWPTVA